MAIETKYNIGDEVWFTCRIYNIVYEIKGKISEIHVNVYKNQCCISYISDGLNMIGQFSSKEDETFPSKGRIIKQFVV